MSGYFLKNINRTGLFHLQFTDLQFVLTVLLNRKTWTLSIHTSNVIILAIICVIYVSVSVQYCGEWKPLELKTIASVFVAFRIIWLLCPKDVPVIQLSPVQPRSSCPAQRPLSHSVQIQNKLPCLNWTLKATCKQQSRYTLLLTALVSWHNTFN